MKKLICLFFIVLLLPSCVQYVNWFNCTFMGGKKNDVSSIELAYPYICAMHMYHQFQTVGLFDALWLTRDSISVFAELKANRLGLDCKEEQKIFKKEFSKTKNKLVFYLLVPKKTKRQIVKTDSSNFPWAVYLSINTGYKCQNFQPSLIKKIFKLRPEYHFILSYNYNKFVILNDNYLNFRQPYRIEFDLKSISKAITINNIEAISLIVSSVQYRSSCCTWELPICCNLDNYVNI